MIKPFIRNSILGEEMSSNQQKNQHLWWRAGFGPPSDQVHALSKQKPEALFHSILKASEKKPELFDVADPGLKELVSGNQVMGAGKMQGLKPKKSK